MTGEKLEPCPVCGETPDGIVDATKVIGLYRITHRCKVWTSFSLEAETPERVASRWNTRASGWQDIASAPKDGTHILAYWPPIFERTDNAAQVETWFNGSIWENSWDQEFDGTGPTFWMPLPPTPKGEG